MDNIPKSVTIVNDMSTMLAYGIITVVEVVGEPWTIPWPMIIPLILNYSTINRIVFYWRNMIDYILMTILIANGIIRLLMVGNNMHELQIH